MIREEPVAHQWITYNCWEYFEMACQEACSPVLATCPGCEKFKMWWQQMHSVLREFGSLGGSSSVDLSQPALPCSGYESVCKKVQM